MFDKQYRFRGSHAERVIKLTSQFESISGTKVFERNVDVLCDAPLIGFLYNRRADTGYLPCHQMQILLLCRHRYSRSQDISTRSILLEAKHGTWRVQKQNHHHLNRYKQLVA